MSHEIIVGTRHEEGSGEHLSVWHEGLPVNSTQLVAELEALSIAGVRTYSVFGRPGECAGVYAWADSAPPGEYRHLALSPADEETVKATIRAHVPA